MEPGVNAGERVERVVDVDVRFWEGGEDEDWVVGGGEEDLGGLLLLLALLLKDVRKGLKNEDEDDEDVCVNAAAFSSVTHVGIVEGGIGGETK